MPDEKITDLAALTGANLDPADLFSVVDASDVGMAVTGTDKSMTALELAFGLSRLVDTFSFGIGQWKTQGPDNSTTTPAINTLYLAFIMLPKVGVQLDAIAYPVNSAGIAGSVTRLGLYDDDGTGVRPVGAPLIDAGTIAGDSAGNKSIVFGAPITAKYNKVWAASVVQTQNGGAARRWTGALQTPFYVADLTSLFSSANNSQGWTTALGAGAALPTILAGTTLSQVNQGPMVAVRRYA